MSSAVSLTIVGAVVLATVAFALMSMRRVPMTPQEYILGGRTFGAVFLWVLLAGEIYTSFTFLGAAGWAYGFGAPAFYIISYGSCAYIIGYFLLPAIWRVAKQHGLLTSPDFLVSRYNSRALGVFAALVQCALIVPYVTLQLTGLQILLSIAGYGIYDARVAAVAGFVLITAFVFATGLRGTAWASIIKDVLVLGALIFVGLAIPIGFFGSPAGMLTQLLRAHPTHLVLPSGAAPHGTIWFVTTVILAAIGFYMNPAGISATYSARDENVLRRNAVFLPLYQLVMLLVFMAGFSALLIVPGLHGQNVDRSFLLVVQHYYPPWILGFVCAAGALCALVPATSLLLGAAAVVSKNVLSDAFGIATGDRARVIATRALVVVIALFALLLWMHSGTTLVDLLLLYYNGITQFAPAFIAAFVWPRANVWGVSAGLVGGLAAAAYFTIANTNIFAINPGLLALAVNVTLVIVVSLATTRQGARASGAEPN